MKVGDYIHYRFSNYRANGVSVNSGIKPNPNAVFKNQKNAILQSLPDRGGSKAVIKATLEQQLNFFFNPNANGVINIGYNAEEISQIQQSIINMCQSAISGLSAAKVNYDSLNVYGGNNQLSQEIANLKNITARWAKEGKNTNKSAMYRKIKALVNHRAELMKLSKGQLQTADLNFIHQVENLVRNHKDVINDLKANLSKDINGKVIIREGFAGQKGVKTGGTFKYAENKTFIDEIRELLDMSKQTTNTSLQGALGEFVPVASQYVYKMMLEKGLNECLDELNSNTSYHIDIIKGKITGDIRSQKVLDSSKVLTKRGHTGITTTINDIEVSAGTTQDKVDIIADIPNNQTINASVKNYNLSGKYGNHIGILSGTSSLKYLQEYPHFTNHYLNITANDGRDDPAPSSLVQQAHNIAKMTLVLHALTGAVWGKQSNGSYGKSAQAEILIVNDNSTNGHFKVYFMSDILKNIIKNIDLATVKGFNSNYTNNWVESYKGEKGHKNRQCAYKRAANVLAQLHQQKLEVSISIDAL